MVTVGPRPIAVAYPDTERGKVIFAQELQAWQAAEAARLEQAAQNKRHIWETEFPKKRKQLIEIEALGMGKIVGDIRPKVISIFDWIRDRVTAAREMLGAEHELTKKMTLDWHVISSESSTTRQLLTWDFEAKTTEIREQAHPVWEQGKKAWAEVEARRQDQKTGRSKRQTRSKPDGPEI